MVVEKILKVLGLKKEYVDLNKIIDIGAEMKKEGISFY